MPSARPVAWPMLARQIHTVLGMVIAPSILMFAVTGGLQIFRLQESQPGYTPAPVIEKLGRVHKDQVFAMRAPRAPRPEPARPAGPAAPEEAGTPATPLSKSLLQWFFVLVSVGLFLSTLLGVWMGVTMGRLKIVARWALLAGTVIPVAILLLP
jgi:hypothetical protein